MLGFEIRDDVGYGGMRWITLGQLGQLGQPDTALVLEPPAADSGKSEGERRFVVEMMAKGNYARILLATEDLDAAFDRIRGLSSNGTVLRV